MANITEIMTSVETLAYVLKELDCEEICYFLINKKVRSVRKILFLDKDNLDEYVKDDSTPVEIVDRESILQFKKWSEYQEDINQTTPDYRFLPGQILMIRF